MTCSHCPSLPEKCADALRSRLLCLPRVRDVHLLFSQGSSPSLPVDTVKVVLVCDAPPTVQEVEHLGREILPENWLVTVTATPLLPLRPDGTVDEDVLAGMPGIDSANLDVAVRLVSALPQVDDCAAIFIPGIVPSPYCHLDHVVPGWRYRGRVNEYRADQQDAGSTAEQTQARSSATPAFAEGAELPEPDLADMDLANLLASAVYEHPARFVLVDSSGDEKVLSTVDVWEQAGRLAGYLTRLSEPARYAILFTDNALQVAAGFWGCLRSGLTAVPLVPPLDDARGAADGGLAKLRNIWDLMDHPLVLTSGTHLEDLHRAFGAALQAIDLDEALSDHTSVAPELPPFSDPDAPAIITFTSGSTGLPKGVPVSFRNLRSMHHAMDAFLGLCRTDVTFNWLPMDHLGPVNFFSLMPALRGSDQIHAPTEFIMKSPLRLLDLFHRWRCANSWLPNFAFNLINAQQEELAHGVAEKRWDLSCVRVMINAGEAISENATEVFCRNLAPCGLSPNSIWPAFGMTESTTGITYCQGLKMAESTDPAVKGSVADLGPPVPGTRLRIVDNQGRVQPEDRVGLLQIASPQIIRGYFKNPAADAESFTADGWFITGDLAFLRNNHLFVTGRVKEVVIINGLNYNCHELDVAVESVSGVTTGSVAAVAARPDPESTEELTVFFHPEGMEIDSEKNPPWHDEDSPYLASLIGRIKETLAAKLAVTPARCLPVAKNAVPRTATGKVQRVQLSSELASGSYERLALAVDILEQNSATLPPWFHQVIWRPCLPKAPRVVERQQVWLLLHAGQPVSSKLASHLASTQVRLIAAESGTSLRRLKTDCYTLPADDTEAFAGLMDLLDEQGASPELILDARSLGPAADTPDAGCLLPLASILTRRFGGGHGVPRLIVLADRAVAVQPGDKVDPRRGMLPALTAAVARETGAVSTFVDVSPAGVEGDLLLGELLQPAGEAEVAWRGGKRLVRRLIPLDFSSTRSETVNRPDSTILPMISGQACIVTGGLGGIGILLCRRLLEMFQARIIIFGRSELNGDQNKRELFTRLQEFSREQGGELHYLAVDVADTDQLAQALAELPSGWEDARVYHLAGQQRLAGLEIEDMAGLAAQWRLKAGAAETFLRWSADRQGRFVSMFSSVNSIFPTMGTAAYAAANRAMEELVTAAAAAGLPAQCLAWSSWADTGMNRKSIGEEAMGANGYYLLDQRRALFSLEGLFSRTGRFLVGLDQTRLPALSLVERKDSSVSAKTGLVVYCETAEIPSTIRKTLLNGNMASVDEEILRIMRPIVIKQLPRDAEGRVDCDALTDVIQGRSVQRAPPRSWLDKLLLDRMCKELELAEIGVDENFFALGGHSLQAARFLSQLQRILGVEVSLQDFFRNPTVAGLAKTMLKHEASSGRLEAMARLRMEVESLSPEELQSRLGSMRDSVAKNHR